MNTIMRTARRGYLLPMVLIFIVISLIVGSAIYYVGSSERIAGIGRLQQEQAFYLAEAGLHRAFAIMNEDEEWQPEGGQVALSGIGTYEVTRLDLGANHETSVLTSTGRAGTRQARVAYVLVPGPPRGTRSYFADGLFGGEFVIVSNNAVVDSYNSANGAYNSSTNHGSDGDIGSNLSISVGNNGIVRGDAAVTEDGSIAGTQWITGDKVYDADERTLNDVTIPTALTSLSYPAHGDPRITPSSYYTISNGVLTISGNRTVTIDPGAGSSDFHFSRIVVENNATLTINRSVRFYLNSDLDVGNNAEFRINAPYDTVIYLGTGGQVIANSIDISNNSKINIRQPPHKLRIYAAAPIVGASQIFNGNNAEVRALFYAPGRPVQIQNNVSFSGGVVAKSLDIRNNALVHFDIALRDMNWEGEPGEPIPAGFVVVSWSKPDWVH